MMRLVLVIGFVLAASDIAHADPPAQQPTEKAARRAKLMKRVVRSFGLHLVFYGDADTPHRNLTLSVTGGWGLPDGSYRQAAVTVKQAEKIIDHLVADGFLDRAVQADHFTLRAKPCYTMNVHVDDEGFTEEFGWGLPLLYRLDALRKVLDGNAAKQMDWLLEPLAAHRKEWEKEAKTFMKGWRLHIWQQGDDVYYSLMPGTNWVQPEEQVVKEAVKGIDAIKPKLAELKTGEEVFPCGRRLRDAAPKEPAMAIKDYCKSIGLDVQR